MQGQTKGTYIIPRTRQLKALQDKNYGQRNRMKTKKINTLSEHDEEVIMKENHQRSYH